MWAGVATIDPQRIADVAKLPSDYDFASSLLRVVAQRGAAQLALPEAAMRDGHGIQRDSHALVAKGRAALVAALGERSNWIDRFLIAPLARLALPPLVARGVPARMLAAAGWWSVRRVGGFGPWLVRTGPGAVVVALAFFALAEVLAWLRDERRLIAVVKWSTPAMVALATMLLGRQAGLDAGTATAPLLALSTVIAGALAERAAGSGSAVSGGRRPGLSADPAARGDRRPAADRPCGGGGLCRRDADTCHRTIADPNCRLRRLTNRNLTT